MLSPEPSNEPVLREIPRWLLRHICKPEGGRLVGKWKHGRWETTNWNNRHLPSRYAGDYTPISRGFVPARDIDHISHLDLNDYRLWAEVRWPMLDSLSRLIMARCRWCHERFPIREFAQVKRVHKDHCNFTHNLREIFAICLEIGNCLGCGKPTREQRWGVPICSPDCRQRWMFATDHSEPLAKAVIRARCQNKIKENLRIIHATFSD
jgi:hypothetical protein